MIFPNVSGSNLLRQKINLPDDLQGDLNVVLIAFQQWHQNNVDTWIPFVQQLEENSGGRVLYYEFPVIQSMNVVARTFINEGMRAGIPNSTSRERTITLYVNKSAFRKALDLPDEQDIYVLLVDRQGNVWWRAEGKFTEEKGRGLETAVLQTAEVYA